MLLGVVLMVIQPRPTVHNPDGRFRNSRPPCCMPVRDKFNNIKVAASCIGKAMAPRQSSRSHRSLQAVALRHGTVGYGSASKLQLQWLAVSRLVTGRPRCTLTAIEHQALPNTAEVHWRRYCSLQVVETAVSEAGRPGSECQLLAGSGRHKP